jgi:hypothetical protein
MLIVYLQPGVRGWAPISYMVTLAAELLEAELLILDKGLPSFWKRLEAIYLSRQKTNRDESCLLICPDPTCLLSLLLIDDWRSRFKFVAAWIIDSFWLDWIPTVVKRSQLFDHLFVTTEEDIPEWNRVMQTPTTWLPWGTDVLRCGGKDSERAWDLLRVGRQPPEWEDDLLTKQACFERNLQFHGRPKFFDDAIQDQKMLMQLYRQTKFLLAFSNAVNRASYTHPSREYITARWVDALAGGAVVAGIPPRESSIDRLFWEGATLNLGSICQENGLEIIAAAANDWKPEQAERNYQQALARLDWRWRFAVIADMFQESPKRLNAELQLIHQKIQPCN